MRRVRESQEKPDAPRGLMRRVRESQEKPDPPRGLMRRVRESQEKPEGHGRVTDKATQRPARSESLSLSPAF